MDADLLCVLTRVARAVESVVPELSLDAKIGEPQLLENEVREDDGAPEMASPSGEWVRSLGFEIRHRGVGVGGFEHASIGSEREQIQAVALELMSEVQDIVSEATTEPWPPVVVNNRKDMAMADAVIEGDDLHLWYGDREYPALRLPSVHLV